MQIAVTSSSSRINNPVVKDPIKLFKDIRKIKYKI